MPNIIPDCHKPVSPRQRAEAFAAPTYYQFPGALWAVVSVPISDIDCGLFVALHVDRDPLPGTYSRCVLTESALPRPAVFGDALSTYDALTLYQGDYRDIAAYCAYYAAYWTKQRPLCLATGVDVHGHRFRPVKFFGDQPFQPNLYRGTIWRIDQTTGKRTVLRRVYN